jgi:aminopeptidase N
VEADFLDGMEFDGLIFLSHAFYDFYTGDQKSNLTIIAAHEVAHQWWYGYVGNDQALEPWLDETLSTFSELYFYENVYPDLAGWYWENRVTFHEPQGWVDSTIYDAAGFYPYRDAVYLRGAMFLRELRDLMGEEPFLEFLRDYLRRFSYRQATADDFFSLLSEHTQADLSGLIGTYFENR